MLSKIIDSQQNVLRRYVEVVVVCPGNFHKQSCCLQSAPAREIVGMVPHENLRFEMVCRVIYILVALG